MQIEHDELITAVSDVLSQRDTRDTRDGVTTAELCKKMGWSKEYALVLIDDAITRGELESIRVWRNTNAGYRTRVPGWQLRLCPSDSNS